MTGQPVAAHADLPVSDLMRIDGKVAMVTGAGSGFGQAAAILFAQAGASVVVTDIDEDAAKATAEQVSAFGPALAVKMDVADEAAVQAAFALAAERFGGVDLLLNNAAARTKAPTLTMSVDEWDRMHAVTARGTFLCLREAVKQMKTRGGGAIVNVSSVSALRPTIYPNMHYDSAKAGVNAITRLAAIEFAGDGIRVNTLLPGSIASAGQKKIQAIPGAMEGPGHRRVNPFGRSGHPTEFARVALFLLSPAASYVNGAELRVDAGSMLN